MPQHLALTDASHLGSGAEDELKPWSGMWMLPKLTISTWSRKNLPLFLDGAGVPWWIVKQEQLLQLALDCQQAYIHHDTKPLPGIDLSISDPDGLRRYLPKRPEFGANKERYNATEKAILIALYALTGSKDAASILGSFLLNRTERKIRKQLINLISEQH